MCDTCPEGRYTRSIGSIVCDPCPAGSTVLPGPSNNNTCIQCDLGKTTYGNGGPCVPDTQSEKPVLSTGAFIAYLASIAAVGAVSVVIGSIYHMNQKKQNASLM